MARAFCVTERRRRNPPSRKTRNLPRTDAAKERNAGRSARMIIRLYLTSEMAERSLSEKRESMKETRPTSRWQTRQSDRELGNMSQSRRPARYGTPTYISYSFTYTSTYTSTRRRVRDNEDSGVRTRIRPAGIRLPSDSPPPFVRWSVPCTYTGTSVPGTWCGLGTGVCRRSG